MRSGAAAPRMYEEGSCDRLVGYSATEMPAPKRSERPRRIRIAKPAPVLDNGRYAVKRTVGDTVAVSADIFRDGHEKMKAVVKYKAPGGRRWLETELHAVDAHVTGVRWAGEFTVETPGTWQWTVEAWTDRWATWHDELRRKVAADLDEDLTSELSEGVIFLKRALEKARGDAKGSIEWAIGALESDADINHKFDVALGPELFQAMEETQEREGACAAGEADHGRGGPRPRPLLRLVRAVPALVGRHQGRRGARPGQSPTSASTSCTCCRSTRSASTSARAATTRSSPARTIPAARTRSAAPRAATSPCTPSWAPSRTSATCAPPPTSTGWTWRWTSRSTPPPTTRG